MFTKQTTLYLDSIICLLWSLLMIFIPSTFHNFLGLQHFDFFVSRLLGVTLFSFSYLLCKVANLNSSVGNDIGIQIRSLTWLLNILVIYFSKIQSSFLMITVITMYFFNIYTITPITIKKLKRYKRKKNRKVITRTNSFPLLTKSIKKDNFI